MTVDPTVTVVAVFGFLTWLLGISFALGRYSSKQDTLDAAVQSINGKLDHMAKLLPHVCIQAERMARVEEHVRQLNNIE